MNKKQLKEARNAFAEEIITIVDSAEDGLTDEQMAKIDELKEAVDKKDKEIAAAERAEKEKMAMANINEVNTASVDQYEKDVKEFANYIRNPQNASLTQGANGGIVPATIANKIIDKIKTLSSIYNDCTKYTVKGTLNIPYVSTSTDNITVAFCDEGDTPTDHANAFATISLTGYLYRSIVKISKKLINNTDFDLVEYIVDKTAREIVAFVENAIFNGYKPSGSDTYAVKGIMNSYDTTNMALTYASTIALSDLIALKNKIPQELRKNAKWYMRTDVKTTLESLVDTNGRPLLQPDPTGAYSDRIFGLPVKESEKVPAGTVIFCNPEGVAVKEPKEREIVADESVYRASGYVGVFSFGEIDCAVENAQCVACLFQS